MSTRSTRATRSTSRQTTPHAPRQSKGEATRQRLLTVAADLFHAKGVDGTGLDEILRQAGAGKSQFYRHFPSKEALVCAVLAQWEANLSQSMTAPERPLDSLDALEAWLYEILEALEADHCLRGCPIGTIAAGLDDVEEDARGAVRHCFGVLEARLREALSAMQKSGELRAEADVASLAHLVLAAQQGSAMLTKAYGDSQPARHALAHTLNYLRSFSSSRHPEGS